MANKNIFVVQAKFLGGQEAVHAIRHQIETAPVDTFSREDILIYLDQVTEMFKGQVKELRAQHKANPLGD